MNKFNPHPFKKPVFLFLYFGSLTAFLIFAFNFYDLHKSRQKITPPADIAKTAEIPNTQTPQALITNFYSLFAKTPNSRENLVKQYTTANFQKKYYDSVIHKTKMLTCGSEYTQTITLAESYTDTDKKIIYPVTLQYDSAKSQSTINVKIASSNHKYFIDDVVCPGADIHVVPKKTN